MNRKYKKKKSENFTDWCERLSKIVITDSLSPKELFEVEDYNDNIDIDGSPIFNYGRFIDDFKNYMEGE